MTDLQELIFRGRFVMADAPERLKVFEYVNGKRNTDEIAKLTKRHINNVRRDLTILADAGLIQPLIIKEVPIKKDKLPIYEKVPLARTIPMRYFSSGTGSTQFRTKNLEDVRNNKKKSLRTRMLNPLPVPSELEILDIAKNGESQIYEFKGQNTEVRKITREIAAFLNTSQGGIIVYGIDDDGNIEGSGINQQKLDQPLQNSIRNSISPSATIHLHSVKVMGNNIIVIIVPPWNKKDIYQFEEKILIRLGTNVFAAKPDQARTLHSGIPII